MAPTIILVRHGQAEHNATGNEALLDPSLTSEGRSQCLDLRHRIMYEFPLATEIEAIISSPATRAIETALLGFDWALLPGQKVEVNDLWQETSDKPCDTCSEVSELKTKFPSVDLAALRDTFPAKRQASLFAFTKTAVLTRGQMALREIYSRPEKAIVVVSHLGFLMTAVCHRRFANADFRVFDFAPDQGSLWLMERDATAYGGGMGRSGTGEYVIKPDDFPPEPGMYQDGKEVVRQVS
ncbi:hypothetical protein KVT40_007860 [Elsinoe batatas]|uniref:Phosphoglycerate mutase-like protein n=1 Tax=Elsinoe batatas TaxID=2601811 RepID=A0A8K0PF15_9PEZI|nr:hypothetical protein KVT40_007860 [Elsinoe batatas]